MLTSKERADFRAQANTLETTLMVGKDGVTEAVAAEADRLLTARELIKGKVLESALMSAREVSDALRTGGLTDGIADLSCAHESGFQNLALYQLSCSQQAVSLRSHGLCHPVLAYHQGSFQGIGPGPKICSFLTCQHNLPP